MIPMMMTIAIRHQVIDGRTGRIEPDPHGLRLWLPLFLLWLLIAPFVLVLSPLIIMGLALAGLNPFRVFAVLFGILASLSGIRVDVDAPGAVVDIHIL